MNMGQFSLVTPAVVSGGANIGEGLMHHGPAQASPAKQISRSGNGPNVEKCGCKLAAVPIKIVTLPWHPLLTHSFHWIPPVCYTYTYGASKCHKSYLVALDSDFEPRTYRQATQKPVQPWRRRLFRWQSSMVCGIVRDLPLEKYPMGRKIGFKIKW